MTRMGGNMEVLLVIVVLMIVTSNAAHGSTCSKGYHSISDSEFCCKSVNCSRDHQFHFCKYDGGDDTCTACPAGTINPDEVNTEQWSDFLEVCHIPKCECLPGAVLKNNDECMKTDKKFCVCNLEEWFYGNDPLNCVLATQFLKNQVMKEGMELLQSGNVGQCLPGHFKPQKNGSVCYAHSQCPEGFLVDVPGTSVTDTTCKKNPSTPVHSDLPDSKNTEENEDKSGLSIMPIVGLVLGIFVGLAVLFGLVVLVYKLRMKRSSISIRRNDVERIQEEGSSGSSGDPLMEQQPPEDEQSTSNNASMSQSNPAEIACEASTEVGQNKDVIMESQSPCLGEQSAINSNCSMLPNKSYDSLNDALPRSLSFTSLMSSTCREPIIPIQCTEETSKSVFDNIPIAQVDSYVERQNTISRDQGIGNSDELSKEPQGNASKQPMKTAVAERRCQI